jgi:kynurenine 3-monooxygenase
MMIALPNPDGSFTCTLFLGVRRPRSFATTVDDDDVRRFFDDEFPDAVPLMPALLRRLPGESHRAHSSPSVARPGTTTTRLCLVGDAAHAVVPFYGRGMNAAFEDCVVFDECLAEFPNDRKRAFAEYLSGARKTPMPLPILRCTIL